MLAGTATSITGQATRSHDDDDDEDDLFWNRTFVDKWHRFSQARSLLVTKPKQR